MTLTPDQKALLAHLYYTMKWEEIVEYIREHSGNRYNHEENCAICVGEVKVKP